MYPRPAKKKRTPRDKVRERERAEKKAIADAVRDPAWKDFSAQPELRYTPASGKVHRK